MEQIKIKLKNMSLQKAFIVYVLFTFIIVVTLSAAIIIACISTRSWLLPVSDEVFLNIEETLTDGTSQSQTCRMKIGSDSQSIPLLQQQNLSVNSVINAKYSITSRENNFSSLTPQRKLLYQSCGIAMVVLPIIFSFSGILLCGFKFYKKKLKEPIDILSSATDKIALQDLDFKINYDSDDELGKLCNSFEQMKDALKENNKKMWEMLEERRNLQASVAHDLRNPIAIIEGYAEYLQINLPKNNIDNDKVMSVVINIRKSAKRLEYYTESMRTINNLEDLEIRKTQVDFSALHAEMIDALTKLVDSKNIILDSENLVSRSFLVLDPQVLYRILENLIGNASRFAKSRISLSFSCVGDKLHISVIDDGCGFSEKALNSKNNYFISESSDEKHSGIGLTICRILAQKHGGSLILGNTQAGGAMVKIILTI